MGDYQKVVTLFMTREERAAEFHSNVDEAAVQIAEGLKNIPNLKVDVFKKGILKSELMVSIYTDPNSKDFEVLALVDFKGAEELSVEQMVSKILKQIEEKMLVPK